MNRPFSLVFLGASLSAALFGAACSSSSNSATGGNTTTGTATAKLDCASYCDTIATNCTAAHQQYPDKASCTAVCGGFSAQGALGDTSGDTLGCRLYHAGAAAGSEANATTHCPHAGPTGGDKDPKGTGGVCGEPCTAFCAIAAKVCTGANQQFADTAACTTACQGFAADADAYSTADTAKNDMGCRFYHLSVAASSAANATTHCPHIVAASSTCTM